MVSKTAAQQLAEYAVNLRYDDIPADVIAVAKAILEDAVACSLFGARFEWSRIVAEQLAANAPRPEVPVGGFDGISLGLAQAPLLFGTMCHAYELDSLRSPGAGVHAGATVAMPVFAHALADPDLSPEALLTAIVAGCEVMYRIGLATLHSAESAGFHAPGLTGVFGAATIHALLRGATAQQLTRAYGISGSMAGGLLAFASAPDGGMIKRLHLGRAAEGGFLSADLAIRGFEGPSTVLEGRYGLLDAFCPKSDPELLTSGLGSVWETRRTCFKRYAAHITAHGPVEKIGELREEFGFGAEDVASLELSVSNKVLSHHNIPVPSDIMTAQYSTPFMAAVSLHEDIRDPSKVCEDLLRRDDVRKTIGKITLQSSGAQKGWAFEIAIVLHSGQTLARSYEGFSGAKGDGTRPLWLSDKVRQLTERVPGAEPWLDRLSTVIS